MSWSLTMRRMQRSAKKCDLAAPRPPLAPMNRMPSRSACASGRKARGTLNSRTPSSVAGCGIGRRVDYHVAYLAHLHGGAVLAGVFVFRLGGVAFAVQQEFEQPVAVLGHVADLLSALVHGAQHAHGRAP